MNILLGVGCVIITIEDELQAWPFQAVLAQTTNSPIVRKLQLETSFTDRKNDWL